MLVIKCNRPAKFDVDQTLIMWDGVESYDRKVSINGRIYGVNEEHVQRIKDHKSLGHKVTVWSKSGWEHAERTVKALKLEPYVYMVECKPLFLYDDAPLERTFPSTQYVGALPVCDLFPKT